MKKSLVRKMFLKDMGKSQKEDIIKRQKTELKEIKEMIIPYMEDIRRNGDKALLKIIKQFDGVEYTSATLKVSSAEIKDAYSKVDKKIINAIKDQIKYSKKFHKKQIKSLKGFEFENEKGVILGERYTPIDSVGLYVPGGLAPYPTVMQILAVPAKLAGVKRIVACTPKANLEVLIAADLAGVDEIYKIGGSQAIATMAYGTETIDPVNKIVGPGSTYVTAAKMLVSEEVSIDMPAGPSEALIISDKGANPKYIAADMLARCEHSDDALAVALTPNEKQADEIIKELNIQKQKLSKESVIDKSLEKYSAVIIVDSLEEAIEFSNEYAPEHLELMLENPREVLPKIKNAGSIFMGYYSPVAIGDYASGVNHVLPTSQYAKVFSPIGVETFMKKSEYEYLTKEGLDILNKKIVEPIAAVEGFDGHARSVSIRLDGE